MILLHRVPRFDPIEKIQSVVFYFCIVFCLLFFILFILFITYYLHLA